MNLSLRKKSSYLLILLLIAGCLFITNSQLVGADGFAAPHVNVSRERHVSLPSQKAAIFWNGSREKLTLSTKIQGRNLTDLAWITPVPSCKKPQVSKGDPSIFKQLPLLMADVSFEFTSYSRDSVPDYVYLILLLAGIVVFVAGLLLLIHSGSKLGLILIFLGVLLFLSPFFLAATTDNWIREAAGPGQKKLKPVEVLENKQVGIYDVLVLQATNASYMVNWLQRENFQVPDRASDVLDQYCSQDNFYFVVNRVNVAGTDKKVEIKQKFAEGAAMPLAIEFWPKKPFYPLEMSSLNPGEATIDVYLFSHYPFLDETGPLRLEKMRNPGRFYRAFKYELRSESGSGSKRVNLSERVLNYSLVSWFRYQGNLESLKNDSWFGFNVKTCDRLYDTFRNKGWNRPADVTRRDQCLTELAKYERDLSICGDYADVPKYCWEEAGRELGNASSCAHEWQSDRCYATVAQALNRERLCNKIEDENQRRACLRDLEFE